ncbi:MAG: hypothetical protein J6X87_08030 [Clostridia bacterium]|nr:hypothetical protein [Clostridia bacterium]
MYRVSIPVTTDFSGVRKEQFLEELARAKPDRVFLCGPRSAANKWSKERFLSALQELVPLMRSRGYEVGVWVNSLGHGGNSDAHPEYTNIVQGGGIVCTDSYCPLDEAFTDEFAEWVAALAGTGPDLIMLDDDYRLGYRSGLTGCYCPLHLKKVSELLGEKITAAELEKKALTGKPNKYRDAWMKANRDSMLGLAKKLRQAVDSVDPSIRLGHCAVLDTWDIDGVDSIELAKTFAGGTKPFMRLIGAAYWAANRAFGCRIANVIELERMQISWCENEDIEIFAEGDVFPRPRYNVPAAYLEALDTALRADGRSDGILKYMIDYECTPFYERGYVDCHVHNMPLYGRISDLFDGLKPCGVRIFDCMHRLKDAELPEGEGGDSYVGNDFVPAAMRLLCDNAIPMQYTEPDVTVIFGENARHAPNGLLKHGAVLDAPAARILTERGFDVGLESFGPAVPVRAVYYPDAGEGFSFRNGMFNNDGSDFVTLNMKQGAEEVAEFRGPEGTVKAFRYENGAGERFLIFPFEAKLVCETSMLFRNYAMQSMLIHELSHIRRRPLDAVLTGSPDTYILTKNSENSLAIGIWNFSLDPIYAPKVRLGNKWQEAEFVNCTGTLEGATLELSDIGPFGMAFALLKK